MAGTLTERSRRAPDDCASVERPKTGTSLCKNSYIREKHFQARMPYGLVVPNVP
jgi:hypothetical protein